jgi:hypothetical protein
MIVERSLTIPMCRSNKEKERSELVAIYRRNRKRSNKKELRKERFHTMYFTRKSLDDAYPREEGT